MDNFLHDIEGVLAEWRFGPMHRFFYSRKGDWVISDIESLLSRYHIKVFGRDVGVGDEGSFLVKSSQAIWCDYIMRVAGVPLTSKAIASVKVGAKLPKPWGEPMKSYSIISWIVRLFADIFGSGFAR